MLLCFSDILNTLVRNVPYTLRAVICLLFFCFASFCIMKCIKPKDHNNPIAWGWLIGCFISMALAIVYVAI